MEFDQIRTDELVSIVEVSIKGLPPSAFTHYPDLKTSGIASSPDLFFDALVNFYPDEATRRHLLWDYGGAGFWHCFMWELAELVCGGTKYADVRKKLSAAAGKSQTALLSTMSAAIASSIGVVPGVLTPFCALGMLALLKVGREAFCQSFYVRKS
jgi:hypothetical protein